MSRVSPGPATNSISIVTVVSTSMSISIAGAGAVAVAVADAIVGMAVAVARTMVSAVFVCVRVRRCLGVVRVSSSGIVVIVLFTPGLIRLRVWNVKRRVGFVAHLVCHHFDESSTDDT